MSSNVVNVSYPLDIHSSTESRVDELADKFGGRMSSSGYNKINKIKQVCYVFQSTLFAERFIKNASLIQDVEFYRQTF